MNFFLTLQLKIKNPTEYAGLRFSSAYSLVVNCLSDANIKNIKLWQKF